MIDVQEKNYWLAFNVFEGIGPLRFKLLLDYFGSAEKAYKAPKEKLLEIGLGEKLVLKFVQFRQDFDLASYFLRIKNLGVEIITLEDKNYPKLLKEIQNPPPLLYVKNNVLTENVVGGPARNASQGPACFACDMLAGRSACVAGGEIFERKAVAVVGTRMPTAYGWKVTEMIVGQLVASGLVVVSGLARGIDAIAHRTTINNRGLTIGVLGCGLDKVYPPEHKNLIDEIVKSGGAVISELPLGMDPVRGNFPARNRIISGLSLGVVITEAAQDSGSLITASHAAEQGREVFAVPGPITSPMSKGTAELIKKGAKLVSGVEDIFEELDIKGKPAFAPPNRRASAGQGNLSEEERKIWELLKTEDLGIDDIIRKSGLETGQVSSLLSLMEIRGLIKNYKGVYSLTI